MTERLNGGRQDDGNPDGPRTDGARQEGARQDDARPDDARPDDARLDGATAEVVRSYLLAAAEEMRATLIRTSFNPVIYEVHDFGMSMYDADLRLIAEATGLTFFLGANDFSLRKGVEYVGRENLCPGDVVLLNYPYW
ncbi:hydantoinase B/oxoprolinase family protein, partial [Streptosporangium sp. OZ121]|uniref:hydantoinase B/oxoprolinase family protein n=1 Tax=Streptosporangium sp. OZ121 TaxID=3444183 RepID=UPI003F7A2B50